MVIKNKKANVMDFMMTYGWAIICAIIMIGVLAYFGVFSSDTFRTSNNYENSDIFYCIEWDDWVTRDRLLMNCYDFDEENFECVWDISNQNRLLIWKPLENIRDFTGDINYLSQVELTFNMSCTRAIRT